MLITIDWPDISHTLSVFIYQINISICLCYILCTFQLPKLMSTFEQRVELLNKRKFAFCYLKCIFTIWIKIIIHYMLQKACISFLYELGNFCKQMSQLMHSDMILIKIKLHSKQSDCIQWFHVKVNQNWRCDYSLPYYHSLGHLPWYKQMSIEIFCCCIWIIYLNSELTVTTQRPELVLGWILAMCGFFKQVCPDLWW